MILYKLIELLKEFDFKLNYTEVKQREIEGELKLEDEDDLTKMYDWLIQD